MTPARRKSSDKRLRALEQELLRAGPAKLEPNRRTETALGGDEDEQPLSEMLQSIPSSRNLNRAQLLERVRAALRKLAEDPDAYGQCEECDEEIPPGRLEAMPYAELCVACQSRRDGPRGPPTRKGLTDFR